MVMVEGPWRPREVTEANSSAQILARQQESSPSTPPGPLKLRLFGEKANMGKRMRCSESAAPSKSACQIKFPIVSFLIHGHPRFRPPRPQPYLVPCISYAFGSHGRFMFYILKVFCRRKTIKQLNSSRTFENQVCLTRGQLQDRC